MIYVRWLCVLSLGSHLFLIHGWNSSSRRSLIKQALWIGSATASADPALADGGSAATDKVTVTIIDPGTRLGLELTELVINDGRTTIVAVKTGRGKVRQGMILEDYHSAPLVQKRLTAGPFPIQLTFRDLAASGDAFADDGTPLVSAQDALSLAATTTDPTATAATSSFAIPKVSPTNNNACSIQSRRNDVLEIEYEAHLQSLDGPVYDSSGQRGTGLPYQMVLGSGDMLPGVDLGLYDMCPGDVRTISIPPPLAYGSRGNKLFGVPPNTILLWKVSLVSVNSVRHGDARTRDEMENRF